MSVRDLRSLLVALGFCKPVRRLRPGAVVLPRIAYAEEAVAAYARGVRRRTRRLLPVVMLLVVLRARVKDSSDEKEDRDG
jgi:hypothetical protein